MQYKLYTVSVTNGSPVVTGETGTKFLTNAQAGNAFKVKDSAVIYTVASVESDTQLTLSANYQGVTAASQQYQITRDYTPNQQLPEVCIGDQDWPVHLTGTIRKLDSIITELAARIVALENR